MHWVFGTPLVKVGPFGPFLASPKALRKPSNQTVEALGAGLEMADKVVFGRKDQQTCCTGGAVGVLICDVVALMNAGFVSSNTLVSVEGPRTVGTLPLTFVDFLDIETVPGELMLLELDQFFTVGLDALQGETSLFGTAHHTAPFGWLAKGQEQEHIVR